MAESETPLTDASISWHTAYSGYGYERISFQMEHVEVADCRALELELREEIAAARAEIKRLREAAQSVINAYMLARGDRLFPAVQQLSAALAAKETPDAR